MAKKIPYFARNFADVRTELLNFVNEYYPDVLKDFNDASIGSLFIDLNAAIGDNLSFHTDRMYQETQLDFAQERRSIMSIARTLGLKVPGKRPSISIVDFSVTVPTFGDTFDIRYAPTIRMGAQVTGGGKVFESVEDIDFSSPFMTGGIPNRLVVPNRNSNGVIENYTLTKREIVLNGTTKIFKRVLTDVDSKPFLEVILPEDDVLSIDSIITLEGTNFTKDPTLDQFLEIENRWFEVSALAEDKVFVEDPAVISDNAGIKPGRFISVDQRFISEFTDLGFLKLIFGSGTQDLSSLCEFDVNKSIVNNVGNFINNLGLGLIPRPNTTMFVKYRIGGGADSNLGSNVLTSPGTMDIVVNGPDETINNAVKKSIKTNNPLPCLGGKDEPSVDEIRNLTRQNYAAQNRAVTIADYQAILGLMPGRFGVPFRCGVFEEQNKIGVTVIGLDSEGKLTNTSTSTLRNNISEYLSNFRMLNDYVTIDNGRIYNLGFEVDLFTDKNFSKSEIVSNVINTITEFMDINNHFMGENIYLSQLLESINNVGGVLNVVDIRVFNKVGDGTYSLNEVSQPLIDEDIKQIDLLGQFTLFADPNSMFEIKFPNKDIKIRVKN